MATTKTLTPTNQAITLAAFTEKPDNRTNVTNDDKLADAVNALNSNSMNDDTFAANTAAGKRTNLNRSVDWDTLPLGFYGFNLYESATGGTGYPTSQDLGMMMNVKLASNLYAQMCFGQYYYQQRNRSNTTDAWGPWRKSIMYAENDSLADYIKVQTYTGTTNANGLIYPNNLPSGARMLNAYTSQGTIALMQFGPAGFRAYDLSNGAFNILANTEITMTFMYKQ